jgi:hypothetical protein
MQAPYLGKARRARARGCAKPPFDPTARTRRSSATRWPRQFSAQWIIRAVAKDCAHQRDLVLDLCQHRKVVEIGVHR